MESQPQNPEFRSNPENFQDNILASLGCSAGRVESNLVADPEDRLSRDKAHITQESYSGT